MKPLSNMTILVAEDERPVRMLLRVVLETAGARVVEAEHGGVAMRLLELHPEIEILCTDMNMPQVDGAQLIAEARAAHPKLRVVTCSAIDVATSLPELARQCDAIVQKPFVPSELVRAIHEVARPPAPIGA